MAITYTCILNAATTGLFLALILQQLLDVDLAAAIGLTFLLTPFLTSLEATVSASASPAFTVPVETTLSAFRQLTGTNLSPKKAPEVFLSRISSVFPTSLAPKVTNAPYEFEILTGKRMVPLPSVETASKVTLSDQSTRAVLSGLLFAFLLLALADFLNWKASETICKTMSLAKLWYEDITRWLRPHLVERLEDQGAVIEQLRRDKSKS